MDVGSYDQDDGTQIPAMTSKAVGIRLKQGHRIRIESPGGGGFGSPIERDPELVAKDVRLGLISIEAASDQYGVLLSDSGEIDADATQTRRQSMTAAE